MVGRDAKVSPTRMISGIDPAAYVAGEQAQADREDEAAGQQREQR